MTFDSYASMADLYDLAYGDYDEDIDFYENLAQIHSAPVLELGVGTGRVAIKLAQAGFDVTGIDNSPSMLDRARQNQETAGQTARRLRLIEASMTSFDLEQRFGLILVAANTFQHLLTTGEQKACVNCVSRHLIPGGIFTLSVRSPTSVPWEDAGAAVPLLLDWTRRDPETGEQVMKFIAAEPDPARMTRRITYVYDRIASDGGLRRSVFETELRYSTQAEIEALLQEAGLRVTHVYGDFDLSPIGPNTEHLIFVARVGSAG